MLPFETDPRKHEKPRRGKERLIFTGEDDAMPRLMLSILGGVAEFERSLIRERQAQGIAVAKGKGAYRGRKKEERKKALTVEQAASLKERAKTEKKAGLAREFGVSRETLYQYLSQ